jgi:plastocyanin
MLEFRHRSPIFFALFFTIALSAAPALNAFSQASTSQINSIFNPQPGYYKAREDPSFAITIPFSEVGYTSFLPTTISIPKDMTVIWFNEDQNPHSVTVNATSSKIPPGVEFDSGVIAPGGLFIHKFTEVGTYDYYDRINPTAKGMIKVGAGVEKGNNMDMLIGGGAVPFNPSKLSRVTFSFVPHGDAAVIPPALGLTYNVTIANSTTVLYRHQFVDSNGILDLELVPFNTTGSSGHFDTWGPDLLDSSGRATEGVVHVQGPVLIEDKPYTIKVSIVAVNAHILSAPVSDTFLLPPFIPVKGL